MKKLWNRLCSKFYRKYQLYRLITIITDDNPSDDLYIVSELNTYQYLVEKVIRNNKCLFREGERMMDTFTLTIDCSCSMEELIERGMLEVL